MHPGGDRHLHVAVDDRSTGPPEAVPEEEVVPRGRVLFVDSFRPTPCYHEAISDDTRVHGGERIMVVEDEDAVVGVVFGDIRCGDAVSTCHAAARVGARAGLGMTEGIAPRTLDRLADLVRTFDLGGSTGAQIVEERALEHHEIRHAHDPLRADRVERAELLGDPVVHFRRRVEPAYGGRDGEDPRRRCAGFRGERPEQLLEPADRTLHVGLHAALRAFAAAEYISTYRLADAVHE